ncbi:TPA: hypothetical protein JG832_002445 [Enterobacter hormaechei subsp. xiangfangensis]|nr:hypothetical protein [Enterobacter hormaechei subsp. xiangfangensis]HAV1890581.1 hypothetical protein [Enterobacter hormaechei subsp. xiangfangensis]
MNDYPKDVNSNTMGNYLELEKLAKEGRKFLSIFMKSSRLNNTRGLCLYGSWLVKELVTNFTPHTATIRGGDGEGDGGYYHSLLSRWFGHYWVEVATDGGTFLIDITGDQFSGGSPVLVAHIEEPPARYYAPGNQSTVDEHCEILLDEIKRCVVTH